MIHTFNELFAEIRQRPRKTLVVPSAEGQSIVEACREACKQGICDVILIGDGAKIRHLLESDGVDTNAVQVVDEKDPEQAVHRGIQLVREGRANMLMKGKTDTPTLLKAVLDADTGLRTGRVLSHVAVMEMPTYPRLMLVTDGGINIRPDLKMKKDIIVNAVELASKLGVARPNVALLSAMEKVNPKMEETVDYDQLVKEQEGNPFVDAVLEGPVAMDVALSAESARIKEIPSAIAGQTDVFVTPEITTCNVAVKALMYLASAKVGGLVVGASAPIVLLSRSDDAETKLRSIALGALWG